MRQINTLNHKITIMKERQLNERESLELITRMMQNTKMNLEAGSGNVYIILGISTLLATLIVGTLLYITQSPISFCAWLLIPIISLTWIKIASNKRARISTKIDKMVNKLWINISFITLLLPLAFFNAILLPEEYFIIPGNKLMTILPFAEILLVSIGLIANAIIIDFKPLKIGGFVGAVLSLLLLFDSPYIHTYIFGLWAIVAMIIPGIKLNHYIKSQKNA